jgi:hypothetical protein
LSLNYSPILLSLDKNGRRHLIRSSLPGFLGFPIVISSLPALATRANACQGHLSEIQPINWSAFLEEFKKKR